MNLDTLISGYGDGLYRKGTSEREALKVSMRHGDPMVTPIQGIPYNVVYYIQFCCRVKIGFSTNVKQRMTDLPCDELLAVEPGDVELERRRHEEFDAYRLTGEWFRYGPRLKIHVAQLGVGPGPVLVDTEAAVEWSGRDRQTIYRWAREGKITRYGGRGNGAARWDIRELEPER